MPAPLTFVGFSVQNAVFFLSLMFIQHDGRGTKTEVIPFNRANISATSPDLPEIIRLKGGTAVIVELR